MHVLALFSDFYRLLKEKQKGCMKAKRQDNALNVNTEKELGPFVL